MLKKMGPLLVTVAALFLALPLLLPQALAFPHRAVSGEFDVRSEAPLPKGQLDAVLADARARIATSPLADPGGEPRSIYLTNGGWRWHWLTLQSSGAFGLTRGLTGYMVLNRSDLAANSVTNGRGIGGRRLLSRVIAHEACHGMVRRHFGMLVDVTKPIWLREGYCDHVADEGSLSDADVAGLKARGEDHPALPYYEGRKKVGAILAANGGNVDRLFAEAK